MPEPALGLSKVESVEGFISQRQLSKRAATRDRKKASPAPSKKKSKKPAAAPPGPAAASSKEEAGVLREEVEELRALVQYEVDRTDKMQRAAELALRALDAHLADGKWSTIVTPPEGAVAGHTFQWMDAGKGVASTAVTIPSDWTDGPVLVRLHRTPVPPRLPAPGEPPPPRPLRPFQDHNNRLPLVGVAETRPVKYSEEWKQVFKSAGVRKSDLSDPVKAMRIQVALAESWDVNAGLPEMPGFTDKLGPLASLSLGPHASDDRDSHVSDLAETAIPEEEPEEMDEAEREAREIFAEIDVDGSGTIDFDELRAHLKAKGADGAGPGGGLLAGIAAELEKGKAGLKKVAANPGGAASVPAADGLAGALSQIKEGKFQLRSAAEAPPRKVSLPPAALDLATEFKAKPIRLRAAGTKTKSGRFASGPVSDNERGTENVSVGIPGVKGLRKTKPREEAPKELSELDVVREKMAKKMQRRLREMEEQDVADSWDEPEDDAKRAAAAAKADAAQADAAQADAAPDLQFV